jgi:hypothetical protein
MPASPVATRFPSSARQIERRTVLRAFVASGLIAAGHPVVSRAQERTPAALALFVGETFVGETSDPETLVAIVLGDEIGGEPRPARGYLCNGQLRTIDVWLTGELAGDQLTLTAEDGSRLSGVRNATGIAGGATLGDGTSLLFTALPAQGIAGLYTVEMLSEGRMAGRSASGTTLVGALAEDEAPEGGEYPYAVTLTPPTQDAIPLTLTTMTTDEGEFRIILLPTGEGRGQGKTRKSRNWIDPDPQPEDLGGHPFSNLSENTNRIA